METFQVAHLNIQSVNVIIIFLDRIFDSKPADEQHAIHTRLQIAATSAGLAGNVVPVWVDQLGRTRFIAPPQQHPFFRTISYQQLYTQVNRTLTCN
ncbi:MAG TPA: hypothetical protein VG675_13080 [Bryobacteraceae bacterium]|nr:hypothetical protein [Bryobacteraceae bacterium]